MKELKDLKRIEKTILLASCDANNFSLHSHVPLKAISRRVQDIPSKLFKKGFHTLLTNGFVIKHPTKGETTYKISEKGLKAGNIINEEL